MSVSRRHFLKLLGLAPAAAAATVIAGGTPAVSGVAGVAGSGSLGFSLDGWKPFDVRWYKAGFAGREPSPMASVLNAADDITHNMDALSSTVNAASRLPVTPMLRTAERISETTLQLIDHITARPPEKQAPAASVEAEARE